MCARDATATCAIARGVEAARRRSIAKTLNVYPKKGRTQPLQLILHRAAMTRSFPVPTSQEAFKTLVRFKPRCSPQAVIDRECESYPEGRAFKNRRPQHKTTTNQIAKASPRTRVKKHTALANPTQSWGIRGGCTKGRQGCRNGLQDRFLKNRWVSPTRTTNSKGTRIP